MRRSIGTGLFFALALALTAPFTSCQKGEGEEDANTKDGLQLSQSHVDVVHGTPVEITIEDGSGQYTLAVAPEDVLGAEIRDGKITLRARKGGPASVTVTDSKSGKTATLSVRALMLPFEWANIPGGTFMMGRPEGEEGDADELPRHSVELSPFRLATTEVTFAQYDAFCAQTNRKKPSDMGYGRDQRPAINVTWEDAQAFCKWAGVQLPTEAQWEYACRGAADNATKFYFGNDEAELEQYAWLKKNSGGKTHPVKEKKPNAYGLYDMHGNVSEWCEELHSPTYYEECAKRGTVKDPVGPRKNEDGSRVARGGNYMGLPKHLRTANRAAFFYIMPGSGLGFRVALPAVE